MAFDFSTLIINRTEADVSDLKALLQRAAEWSEEERAEFNLARHEGSYNYTDLNRVTAAMEYLNKILTDAGFSTGYVPVKNDWTVEDVPAASQMVQYLANVTALKRTIGQLPTTPAEPETMEKLTVTGANAIEQILLDIELMFRRMIAAYRHADAPNFYAAADPLPTSNAWYGRTWAELDALGLIWDDWNNTTFFGLCYADFT